MATLSRPSLHRARYNWKSGDVGSTVSTYYSFSAVFLFLLTSPPPRGSEANKGRQITDNWSWRVSNLPRFTVSSRFITISLSLSFFLTNYLSLLFHPYHSSVTYSEHRSFYFFIFFIASLITIYKVPSTFSRTVSSHPARFDSDPSND